MVTKTQSTISKISLGVVLVLFWIFLFIQADSFFTENVEEWRFRFQVYILMAAVVFGFNALATERTERILFKLSFLKSFPRFLVAAGISLVVLIFFGFIINGGALPEVFKAVTAIGIGVILFHSLFVATLEELVFRGWLPNELRASGIRKIRADLIAVMVFALFHWVIGGGFLTLLIYIPLGLIFTFARDKWSPKTNLVNMGIHLSWNIFILGFLSGI